MSPRVRTVLKLFGGLVALVVVAVVAGLLWARSAANTRLSRTFETHHADIPVPFPLSDAEVEELRAAKRAAGEVAADADPIAGVDLNALAQERAVARGKHLVQARYVCIECHSADFSGGTMIDAPPIGLIQGPNLTGGEGSRAGSFTTADWDRIVRHGVRVDGTPAIMPSQDFAAMSDRELSDIISYVKSLPKVNKTMAPRSFGPLGYVLLATGEMHLSAETHAARATHVREPPLTSDPVAFGKHLAQACTGCHTAQFTGGPIKGGPPDWAPAADLTQLAGWKYEEFERVLRTGKKRDGSEVKLPMTFMIVPGQKMKDEEVKALWAYFQTLPPTVAVK